MQKKESRQTLSPCQVEVKETCLPNLNVEYLGQSGDDTSLNVNSNSLEGEVELAGLSESQEGTGLIYWRPDTTSVFPLITEFLPEPLCNLGSRILEDVVIHGSYDQLVLVETDPSRRPGAIEFI